MRPIQGSPTRMKRQPHPTLEFSDLLPAEGSGRFASLPGSSELEMFFNARSALYHLFLRLRSQGKNHVLLPAYHCVSLVEPALRAGMEVSFFRIDRALGVDWDEVLSLGRSDTAAILFINYFGFPASFECVLPELRAREITVIEDCSHSFLLSGPPRLAGQRADFCIYSFWKLVPSGVGGALWSARTPVHAELSAPPLRDSVVRTKRLLEQALVAREQRSMFARLYMRAETLRVGRRTTARRPNNNPDFPFDPALEFDEGQAATCLPWLPSHILRSADLHRVVTARRANYHMYASRLGVDLTAGHAVLADLPPAVCPWAFPLLVPSRNAHDRRLRERGVPVWTFGDVLHPRLASAASVAAIADARSLADQLMCLPVHQRISPEDVQEFADMVLDYFAQGGSRAH